MATFRSSGIELLTWPPGAERSCRPGGSPLRPAGRSCVAPHQPSNRRRSRPTPPQSGPLIPLSAITSPKTSHPLVRSRRVYHGGCSRTAPEDGSHLSRVGRSESSPLAPAADTGRGTEVRLHTHLACLDPPHRIVEVLVSALVDIRPVVQPVSVSQLPRQLLVDPARGAVGPDALAGRCLML
jgi:hypothetical protein